MTFALPGMRTIGGCSHCKGLTHIEEGMEVLISLFPGFMANFAYFHVLVPFGSSHQMLILS